MQIRSARIISHFISNKYTSKFDARWDKREKKEDIYGLKRKNIRTKKINST
jgi:hypothetical protein